MQKKTKACKISVHTCNLHLDFEGQGGRLLPLLLLPAVCVEEFELHSSSDTAPPVPRATETTLSLRLPSRKTETSSLFSLCASSLSSLRRMAAEGRRLSGTLGGTLGPAESVSSAGAEGGGAGGGAVAGGGAGEGTRGTTATACSCGMGLGQGGRAGV